MRKTIRYIKLKPGSISTSEIDNNQDYRYKMNFDALYEVAEYDTHRDYVRVRNPNSITGRLAHFYLDNVLGPYTKEENPEMFL